MPSQFGIFLRPCILLAAAVTLVGALLTAAFMVTNGDWHAARLIVALYVIGMALWTGKYLLRGGSAHAMLAGSLLLCVAGAIGATFGVMQELISGDLEAWAVMLCVIMTAQGVGTVIYLWLRVHNL